jgi:hypothetical protein
MPVTGIALLLLLLLIVDKVLLSSPWTLITLLWSRVTSYEYL